MRIKVTDEHIKNAAPGDAGSCPIALALNEQASNDDDYGWCVDAYTAECVSMRLRLSKRAQKFVDDFDHHRPVHPAVFIFEVA